MASLERMTKAQLITLIMELQSKLDSSAFEFNAPTVNPLCDTLETINNKIIDLQDTVKTIKSKKYCLFSRKAKAVDAKEIEILTNEINFLETLANVIGNIEL